jgi:hypothetical protein
LLTDSIECLNCSVLNARVAASIAILRTSSDTPGPPINYIFYSRTEENYVLVSKQ